MALSDDALWQIIDAVPGCEERGDGGAWLVSVLRAVETEVRKSDEALIQQLLEALENSNATLWEEDDDPERPAHVAIAAARARLEGKP